jgi:cytochrome b6-f complex iron-sulfur subunit
MKIEESYIGRRRFLCRMLGGGVVALGAGAAVPVVQYAGNLKREPPPDFMKIAKADYDPPPGGSRMLWYGHIPALILRTPEPEGALRVFDATCTHFDCTVSYRPDEDCIFCACHEGRYDLDGQVISGPPPRPLRQFFHAFQDGTLVIALEKENLEKALAEAHA